MSLSERIRRAFADSEPEHRELERAVLALREHEPARDRLSDASRARLFERVRSGELPEHRVPGVFPPLGRILAASAVPVLALGLAIGVLSVPAPGTVAKSTRVDVSKSGSEVLFLIANGRPVHRITRTTDPRSASANVFTTTDGSFRDQAGTEPGVVFYRID